MTKLCARGKSAAKRKFKVYPSAYANAYASKICAGKAKDPSGVKRKDWGPKKAGLGTFVQKLAKKVFGKKTSQSEPNTIQNSSFLGDPLTNLYQKTVKPAGRKIGGEAKGKINKVIGGLKKASKLHAAQAKTLETVKANKGLSIEVLRKETQKIIDNFPKEKVIDTKKPKKKPYKSVKPDAAMSIDTTTYPLGQGPSSQSIKPMNCGGMARGTGAAVRGKGFKGIF